MLVCFNGRIRFKETFTIFSALNHSFYYNYSNATEVHAKGNMYIFNELTCNLPGEKKQLHLLNVSEPHLAIY